MNRIQTLRNRLEQEKGSMIHIEQSIQELQDRQLETGKEIRRHEQAREIIREVGLKTQEQLQYHISDITSMALEAVFDDPYELVVEFVQRRNKTECDLLFARDGQRVDPISASGVGAIDVAAFALRIAAWSMQTPRKHNVIILDEPFRYLSVNYQAAASRMLKELSDRLGIQFIIITHEATLAEYADKAFTVKLKKGVSDVTSQEIKAPEAY